MHHLLHRLKTTSHSKVNGLLKTTHTVINVQQEDFDRQMKRMLEKRMDALFQLNLFLKKKYPDYSPQNPEKLISFLNSDKTCQENINSELRNNLNQCVTRLKELQTQKKPPNENDYEEATALETEYFITIVDQMIRDINKECPQLNSNFTHEISSGKIGSMN